jgi:hypothetical protein
MDIDDPLSRVSTTSAGESRDRLFDLRCDLSEAEGFVAVMRRATARLGHAFGLGMTPRLKASDLIDVNQPSRPAAERRGDVQSSQFPISDPRQDLFRR